MFRILIFISMFTVSAVCAGESKNINQIMAEIGHLMVEQYPLIVATHSLSPAEKKTLYQATRKLEYLFEQAQPLIERKSETYQISYELILKHLQNIEKAFRQNRVLFARKQLRSMGTLCSSCHTQDTQLRTLFKTHDRALFSSDYDYAEFNFMTRNYKTAIKYYDRYLSSGAAKTELDIIMPLQRLMTIYLQVFQAPKQAKYTLSKYLSLKQHSPDTRQQLKGWISGLDKLNAQQMVEPKKLTFFYLKKLVKQYIGDASQFQAELFSTPEEEVARVWLRGRLYHYLNNQPPADQVPAILYWLSICDRTLGYDFNYSFADIYLKDCITRFPENPYAKKCFKEYESFLTLSYSGSGGTFLPPEVEDEIYSLKKILKGE